MKATFATTALLVLALSWTGSGAVEVEVSEELEQEMFIVLDCKVLLISAVSTFMILALYNLLSFSRKMDSPSRLKPSRSSKSWCRAAV